MKKRFNIAFMMFMALAMSVSLGSCKEDILLPDGGDEGEATVTLNFCFDPQSNALTTRGVNGNLDFQIKNLVVLFYDKDANDETGKPQYAIEYEPQDFQVYELLKLEGSRDQDHCENYTYHGMVTMKNVEYGIYRIYAVANVNIDNVREISEKGLRELQVQWPASAKEGTQIDDREPLNHGIPDAMFGYFTPNVADHVRKSYRDVIHHNPLLYTKSTIDYDKIKTENRPQPVTLDKRNLEVQAWLKRVVSKLTIGFDGTGLKSDVEIYIKSVRIVDAAAFCLLGHDNSAGTVNDENYNNTNKSISLLSKETYATDSRLYTKYESGEGGNIVKITHDTPAYPRVGFADNFIPNSHYNENQADKDEDKDGWVDEWYDYIHGKQTGNVPAFTGPTYKDQPTTLYFFENLQGIGKKGYNADYDVSIKDGKPNGTYVEVEAHYKNTKTGKEAEGDIKYRFMLGKNTTDDFNAERNHHYKLILSFIGDANNVDWHIDSREAGSLDVDYGACPWEKADKVDVPAFE